MIGNDLATATGTVKFPILDGAFFIGSALRLSIDDKLLAVGTSKENDGTATSR